LVGRFRNLEILDARQDGAKQWRRRLSEFKGATQQSEVGATKATARLPGLNIEVVHRQSPDGDSEQISINLQAVPSFEAFGPFAFLGSGRPAGLALLARSRARRDAAL
jgi:hypothetical protein